MMFAYFIGEGGYREIHSSLHQHLAVLCPDLFGSGWAEVTLSREEGGC
jgi:hypothetical protein